MCEYVLVNTLNMLFMSQTMDRLDENVFENCSILRSICNPLSHSRDVEDDDVDWWDLSF